MGIGKDIYNNIPPLEKRWLSQFWERYYRLPNYVPRKYVILKKAMTALAVAVFIPWNLSVSKPAFKPYDLHAVHGGEVVVAVGYRSLCLWPSGWVKCSPTEEIIYNPGDTIAINK